MTTREELIELLKWELNCGGTRHDLTEFSDEDYAEALDAVLAKLSESEDDFPRCEAVCFVGPGHQSKMCCELQLGHSGAHLRARDWYEWDEDGECVD